jgi:hypothetical protein
MGPRVGQPPTKPDSGAAIRSKTRRSLWGSPIGQSPAAQRILQDVRWNRPPPWGRGPTLAGRVALAGSMAGWAPFVASPCEIAPFAVRPGWTSWEG